MFEDPRRKKQLEKFIQKLGLPPTAPVEWSLLDLALTHPSISRVENYEQLEFVGDSVVRLISAELLLEIYPQEPVGEFAAVRSILVSDRVLAELAEYYGLEPYLLIGSNATGNPAGRQSWLADAFEAVLGALYLSTHNMDLIRPWLDLTLKTRSAEVFSDPARFNYKDALQEWTQRKCKILPEYQVKENQAFQASKARADENILNSRFVAEVWLKERFLGRGYGRSKKASEQSAAKEAFLSISQEER
ncbi:ribonuclease III [Waterburya agarophytonicola K14]|uniref:Ribonuclease 3 n=1 Tax=Waterburya agarophytonicola KI4 TaxID=2874699 RepID=A0A964BN99_9CYAN|nr:ribonuclease III [Waterburya agarophytonicola]MCC0176568.1 ribonuclease III [Waterburya agarophytonicola KI4]